MFSIVLEYKAQLFIRNKIALFKIYMISLHSHVPENRWYRKHLQTENVKSNHAIYLLAILNFQTVYAISNRRVFFSLCVYNVVVNLLKRPRMASSSFENILFRNLKIRICNKISCVERLAFPSYKTERQRISTTNRNLPREGNWRTNR